MDRCSVQWSDGCTHTPWKQARKDSPELRNRRCATRVNVLTEQQIPPARAAAGSTSRLLNAGCTLLVLVVSIVLFSTPLRHGQNMLAYAQDDFYYYLTITRNLVTGHGSTFDGTTLTNGYHPLYFLLVLGVETIDTSLRAAYSALWLLDVASAITIFLTVRLLISRRISNAPIANGTAVAIVALSALRIMQQMEVTLTLPLGLLLLVLLDRPPGQLTTARWAGIGFLASLVVLSRLDAVFLVSLSVLVILTQRAHRQELSWSKVASFAAAFFPLLLLYLGINRHYFHRWTPISGAAKQARVGFGLHFHAIRDSFSVGSLVLLVLGVLGMYLLSRSWNKLSPQLRVLCTSMLFFPVLQLGTNFVISDWMLFPWYRYSLIFSTTAALLLICLVIAERVPVRSQGPLESVVFIVAIGGLLIVRYVPNPMMVDIADSAVFIRDFARSHPGRYAMGDRAGMVGYIDGVPTVQMEGLVMDDKFLNYIRSEGDIGDVLKQYHVDYYIAFDWRQPRHWPAQGCFHAKEPNQAGPRSPALMDDFCDPPVAQDMRPSGRTIIFDVRGGNGDGQGSSHS